MTTTITTSSHELDSLAEGGYVSITRLDLRWWKRFLHWVTFRKPPEIVTMHQIKSVKSPTTIEIKP